LAEDSHNKEEESKQTTDSTINNKKDGCETGSDVLSTNTSDSELNKEVDGSKIDSKIEKQDGVKSESVSEQTSNHDEDGADHSFNFQELLDNDLFDSIRSKKDQILRYAAAAVGVILIIYGVVLISASVTKVADNVIFGEGASYAAFLMLLGFLIIVGAFSQKILNKTFLKNINSELEIAEGKTKSGDKKTEEPDGKKDPNNVNDDKGNIVGEDKK
jgi:hypothetical protein